MSRKRIVTLDKLTLRLPRHAAGDPQAILREIGKALGENATTSTRRLDVITAPSPAGEGKAALAQRIGRATAARLGSGDGS
jgi:hypothetical protein